LKGCLTFIGLLVLIVAAAGGYAAWDLYRYAETPMGSSDQPVSVSVPSGQSFDDTLRQLQHAGIVRSPRRFEILARLKGLDTKIQAGEYWLTPDVTPRKLLQQLVTGKVRMHALTLPEGYTIRQYAAIVAQKELASAEAFLSVAADAALAHEYGIPGESLEGYLFPDTYHFPKGLPPKHLVDHMIAKFWEVFKPEWEDRARELNMTLHEIVTLASIIEKETGAPAERKLISSVFHNRLQRNMRLQSDPTVIYGLKHFDGNLTRKDLETPTPYNTYTTGGLPPGPIANPGAGALEAALYPAETNHLYFVSRNDGTHHFSASLKEHNRAVRKYQK
jgi:UPF0755 protein